MIDLNTILISLEIPFVFFGLLGGSVFYVWAIYVVVTLTTNPNKGILEAMTFGMITKEKK